LYYQENIDSLIFDLKIIGIQLLPEHSQVVIITAMPRKSAITSENKDGLKPSEPISAG
jgi:hypothetical protein